jgi:signal peptidase I
MASKRRDAPRKSGSDERRPAREPRLLARIVGDQQFTLLLMATLIVVFSGWAIRQKIAMEREVPGPLYLYLAIGIGIAALVGLARLLLGDEIERVVRRNHTQKDSKLLLRETQRCLKSHGDRLRPEQREDLERSAAALAASRDAGDWDEAFATLQSLDGKLEQYFASVRKSTAREYAESIVVAVLIALLLRSFVVEAFKIPSGSMIPTLQVGDHIFVNKFIYGLRIPATNIKLGMSIRKPHRGEVAVFKFPKDPDKDFIKRIVAVEGDTVEIKDEVLYINGKPVHREHIDNVACEYEDVEEVTQRWEHRVCDAWRETLDGHEYTTIYNKDMPSPRSYTFSKITVPPGHVFAMGDNRDNSHDSRFWGFVPFELLKGKAMIIWWSSGEPEGIRIKRIGQLID